jgi:hypothetical protein
MVVVRHQHVRHPLHANLAQPVEDAPVTRIDQKGFASLADDVAFTGGLAKEKVSAEGLQR